MTATSRIRSKPLTTLTLLAGGLSVAAIGLLTLYGWMLDRPVLTMWKTGALPMAPSTAALSILFGAALCFDARMPPRRVAVLLTTLFGWMGAMTSLLLLTLRLLGVYEHAEFLGLRITGTLGDAPLGYISPITAFCFLLANGSLLASLPHDARGSWRSWLAWGFGGLVSLMSYALLLAYAFGTPMYFEKILIHPALNTSLIMLIMGLALLLMLTARQTGLPAAASSDANAMSLPLYILIFVVFIAGTLAVTYGHYRQIEQKFRQQVESQLIAVSELKTDELVRWRAERLEDAAFSQGALITPVVRRLLNEPHSQPAQREMKDWLDKYLHYIGYNRAFLFDAHGATRMSVPGMANPGAAILAERAVASLRLGQVTLQDFYRDEHDRLVYLALIVPILDTQDNNRPLGVVVLCIDPATSLYPLLKNWPTPSATAETLLVRRDGNDVLFLNDPRFRADAALNLRVPLTSTAKLPAVKAVLGQHGIVSGVDYRGVPVIAAVRAVPDSPWYIVTRIDTTEVYAPLRQRLWLTILEVSILVCGTGAVLFLLWRRQRLEFALSIRENKNRHQTILRTVMDGFCLVDTQGRLLEVNDTYCQMSGYSEQELLSMRVCDLEAVESSEDIAAHIRNIMAQGADRFESRHRRKDGSIFDIQVSVQYLPVEDGRFVVFLQDISERKQAEENLHLAASVFTHAHEGIMITAADSTIIDVNDAFSEITGYSRDEILGRNPRFLGSGRQEKAFYTAMGRDLIEKGSWYGEVCYRRKNGEMFAVMQSISAVRDDQGEPRHYVALLSDISALKEHEGQLEQIAHFDSLTSLPNRVLLADRLHQAMVQAQRRGQRLAVAFLDLDGFKTINDNYGHEAGDQLLIALAARMKLTLREGDTLARLGGDEFVAVLLDLADDGTGVPLLTRLLDAAAQPTHIGELVLQVSASLGVTFYPQAQDIDADQLLRQADQSMYQAKLEGKNRYHFFDTEQDSKIRSHHESLDRIRRALNEHEFLLYYQPKVNMRTGMVIGAEALIRWEHPEKGMLLPNLFLPVIEDHPLAVELGEWVIDSVLKQLESWHAGGLNIPVSVNVGARQLQQTDFVERLRALLAAHPGVKPGDLEMEVLETSALEDLAHVSRVINACREIGVTFALDDFGTGYSSLTHLKRLPVTQLKIDQTFVSNMLDSTDDLAILEGVLGLASAFQHQVIAEGVETIEHGEMLLQFDCELAQGYSIARPMPAHEMSNWSATWRTDPSWNDLPAVNHEDLPLLVASVDHRAWVAAIEAFLKGACEIPPPMDCHQCRFGVWLDTKGLVRYGEQPAFEAIKLLHRQVHVLGAELLELQARAQNLEALAKLGELHGLRDALLKQLRAQVLENRQ